MNEKGALSRGLIRLPGYSPAIPAEVQAMLDAAEAAKAQHGKPPLLTRMNAGGAQKKRQVIEHNGFNSAENAAVLALYDALVQEPHIRATRTVNIGLIAEKGFMAFERSIGPKAWSNVKKYYGIGCKADTSCLTAEDLKMHLANMRTIENACAYIDGYWDIIQALYGCLDEYNPIDGIDEYHQILTGAKIAVLAVEVFCGEWFLRRQLKRNMRTNPKESMLPDWLPDYDLCHGKDNLAQAYGPEEVIGVYEMLKAYGPKCINVDMLMSEIWSLQQRGLVEDVMKFCELTFKDNGKEWNIVGNNVPNPYKTIAKVMEMKKRVHPVRSVRTMEAFLLNPVMVRTSQAELWELYAILNSVLENGKTQVGEPIRIDGGYFYANSIKERTTVFELRKGLLISGPREAERISCLAQYIYSNDIQLPYFEKNKELRGPAGQVMMAISVLQQLGCKDAFHPEKAMRLAQEILKMDHTGIMKRCHSRFFQKEDGSEDGIELPEIVAELGITSEHLERWRASTDVLAKKTTEELASVPTDEEESIDWSDSEAVVGWLINWATKRAYKVQEDAEQRKLIRTILVDGNIDKIKALAMKKLNEESFMQEIGFDPAFADMYFARDQVDCDGLTEHLIKAAKQAKQKKKTAKSCTIKLYKYLVNNRLPCGPDMVVIHQNPVLKKFIN